MTDQTARLAGQLSFVAIRKLERALTGIFMTPAAAALGVAATATQGVALIERAFGRLASERVATETDTPERRTALVRIDGQ
jgi:hypothetical protein